MLHTEACNCAKSSMGRLPKTLTAQDGRQEGVAGKDQKLIPLVKHQSEVGERDEMEGERDEIELHRHNHTVDGRAMRGHAAGKTQHQADDRKDEKT